MKQLLLSALTLGCTLLHAQEDSAKDGNVRTSFQLKYVAEGSVYLDAGSRAGLSQGMRLTVRRKGEEGAVAELVVTAVAEASAVCDVKSTNGQLKVGDVAELSPDDVQGVQAAMSSSHARKYAQVVSFTEGDPLDEEVRANVEHPPLPEINRLRGRIGIEYDAFRDRSGSGLFSSQEGLVLRADMTRIDGTYWNLTGFWRGRLNSTAGGTAEQQTLYDLINRTYHLTLYYDNPKSAWVAGFGRFYLPWAASLDTIDGGYFGRRLSSHVTAGIFAGSTPDPTSWNYNPNREMAGTFINYSGGDFQALRYSTTEGVALSRIHWRPERQYAFFENIITYRNYLSIYHSAEVDDYRVAETPTAKGVGLSRSFLTVRLQPRKWISFDLSHNYFQTVPTFDPTLIGTGLLDKLLFQGLSGGVRFDMPYRLSLYASLGRSNTSSDTRRSLNQMYGVTLGQIWHTGIRADTRFTRFDSSFGNGTYKILILSRQMGESLRLDAQVGQQNYTSSLTAQNRSIFFTGDGDFAITRHYFFGGGATFYRGQVQNYDQVYFNLGYRF